MPPNRSREIRWHCLCEGDQEIAYVKRLQTLLRCQGHRATFTTERLLVSQKGIATSMYAGLSCPVVAIFDHDNRETVFPEMVATCQKRVQAAYSNRCFDLWLLLHREDFFRSVSKNSGYAKSICKAYKLDDEANIKSEDARNKIINSITVDDVKDAVHRAERIRIGKLPSDGKKYGKHKCYDNPDLLVHIFVKDVFRQCGITL